MSLPVYNMINLFESLCDRVSLLYCLKLACFLSEIKNKEASFEEITQRLEEIVQRLEKGELSLDQSLSMFEEGVRLSREGGRRLDEAERRVEELLSGNEVKTLPLDRE